MRLIGLAVVLGVFLTPLDVGAQQAQRVYRVGYLGSTPLTGPEMAPIWAAFIDTLRERGWVEGKNISIERRYAHGRVERFDELAIELVRLHVDVLIVASHPAALAARKAGGEVPIVMAGVGDAVRYGLVASLAHPGGNVTGITLITQDVTAKALELLKEVVPQRKHIGFLWNAGLPFSDVILGEAQTAGIHLGLTLRPLEIRRSEDVEPVFDKARRERIDTLLVRADPLTLVNRQQIVTLAAQHKVIAMYSAGEFVRAGGLMSYAVPLTATFRGAAMYLDKILRGGKPADLPVEQPTKFELLINLKTAKTLGLTIPQTLLLRADQLIE